MLKSRAPRSSGVISSPSDHKVLAVRGDSCAAIGWAFSIVPPFSRYAVIPVARNVGLQKTQNNISMHFLFNQGSNNGSNNI